MTAFKRPFRLEAVYLAVDLPDTIAACGYHEFPISVWWAMPLHNGDVGYRWSCECGWTVGRLHKEQAN
jgi:hypothetical protein